MKKLFSISYDLRKPGQNYEPLWSALIKAGAQRALESLWIIRTTASAVQLRDAFRPLMDYNDRLLVTEVGDWASSNTMIDLNKAA